MIIRIARKILGLNKTIEIDDPVYYNSKQNINNSHTSFEYFYKILKRTKFISKQFLTILKDHELLSDNKSIIDIGCGSGNILNLISSEYPNTSLLGTDFSEMKINNCKKVYPHIEFSVHDIYDSLKAKYDLILCTEVLEHLLYPHKALQKLIEGIDKKGTLFITVPNGRINTFKGHIYFWSPESWKIFLEENVSKDYEIETSLFSNNRLIYTIIKSQ